MGVYLGAIMVGVPGIIFLVYCLTPKGRRWMKANLKTIEPMEVHRGSGTMCNTKTSKVISRTDPMIR